MSWHLFSTNFAIAEGQFLTCEGEVCSMSATAKSPSTSETYEIERNKNNRMHIKIKNGLFVQATTESQITADYPGTPGWDDNAATFEMTISANNLHGDYQIQIANGYGHGRAKEVLRRYEIKCIIDLPWDSGHVIQRLYQMPLRVLYPYLPYREFKEEEWCKGKEQVKTCPGCGYVVEKVRWLQPH